PEPMGLLGLGRVIEQLLDHAIALLYPGWPEIDIDACLALADLLRQGGLAGGRGWPHGGCNLSHRTLDQLPAQLAAQRAVITPRRYGLALSIDHLDTHP